MYVDPVKGDLLYGKKRNKNAYSIANGACNPRAIVSAMHRAVDEMVTDGICSSDQMLNDPALKLMVHQLAFLMKIPTGEKLDEWSEWYNKVQSD